MIDIYTNKELPRDYSQLLCDLQVCNQENASSRRIQARVFMGQDLWHLIHDQLYCTFNQSVAGWNYPRYHNADSDWPRAFCALAKGATLGPRRAVYLELDEEVVVDALSRRITYDQMR